MSFTRLGKSATELALGHEVAELRAKVAQLERGLPYYDQSMAWHDETSAPLSSLPPVWHVALKRAASARIQRSPDDLGFRLLVRGDLPGTMPQMALYVTDDAAYSARDAALLCDALGHEMTHKFAQLIRSTR